MLDIGPPAKIVRARDCLYSFVDEVNDGSAKAAPPTA
jgi:hypothetical protein